MKGLVVLVIAILVVVTAAYLPKVSAQIDNGSVSGVVTTTQADNGSVLGVVTTTPTVAVSGDVKTINYWWIIVPVALGLGTIGYFVSKRE